LYKNTIYPDNIEEKNIRQQFGKFLLIDQGILYWIFHPVSKVTKPVFSLFTIPPLLQQHIFTYFKE